LSSLNDGDWHRVSYEYTATDTIVEYEGYVEQFPVSAAMTPEEIAYFNISATGWFNSVNPIDIAQFRIWKDGELIRDFRAYTRGSHVWDDVTKTDFPITGMLLYTPFEQPLPLRVKD